METMIRKKRKPMSEINVVPYIDVMLVLLIVFMVTAPMLNQGIEVDLPQANNEPLNLDENIESLIVSITANGNYFLQKEPKMAIFSVIMTSYLQMTSF